MDMQLMEVLWGHCNDFTASEWKTVLGNLPSVEKLDYKGRGRIVVQNKKDISQVKKILKDMDEFEFEYLPDDYISTDRFQIYTGKFDPNCKQLVRECFKQGMMIEILTQAQEVEVI